MEIVQKKTPIEIATGFQWYVLFFRWEWEHAHSGMQAAKERGLGCSAFLNINIYLTRDEFEVVVVKQWALPFIQVGIL